MSANKDWPHAPVHRLDSAGIYMVPAATLYKEHFFPSTEKLKILEDELLQLAKRYEWYLEAWAVFVNHCPFRCPQLFARGIAQAVSATPAFEYGSEGELA